MWCEDWEKTCHLAAWPESKRLKSAMKEKRRGTKYTMPGLKSEILGKGQPRTEVREVMDNSFKVLDPETNVEGLRTLIRLHEHLFLLEATGKVLTLMGQGLEKAGKGSNVTTHSLEVSSIRLQVLLGTGRHKELLEELSPFDELDAPDLYFQYHNSEGPEKEGSMVPYSLRLVHAEALIYSPLPSQAVTRAQRLLIDTQQVIEDLKAVGSPEEHIHQWEKRLHAAHLLRSRIYYQVGERLSAIESLSELANIADEDLKTETNLALSRSLLEQAKKEEAQQHLKDVTDNTTRRVHNAFLSIFEGESNDVNETMEDVHKQNPDDKMISNNLAVSRVYMGNPLGASEILLREARESIYMHKPLHPAISINLKTIIELTFPTTVKASLLKELAAVLPSS